MTLSDVKGLAKETRDVLLQPARYFLSMPKEGTIGAAMLKVAVYAVIVLLFTGIANLLFHRPGVSATGIIAFPLLGVVVLFLGAGFLMVFSMLCGGNTNFTLNVRTAASLSALSIVQALLTIPMYSSRMLGTLLWLAMSAYGIVLLYFALVNGLAAKAVRAKVLAGVLAGIFVIAGISMVTAQIFLKGMGMQEKVAASLMEKGQAEDVTAAVQKQLQELGYTAEDLKIAEEYTKAAAAGDTKKAEELLMKMQESSEKRDAAKK